MAGIDTVRGSFLGARLTAQSHEAEAENGDSRAITSQLAGRVVW